MFVRRRLVWVVSAAWTWTVACGYPQGAGADSVLAAVARPTRVAAYGGTFAWSTFDSATGHFRLTLRRNGGTWFPHLRTRSVPFDVDLGPGPNGHVYAIYSRCRRDPVSAELPDYATGRACRLYTLDTRTRVERALEPPSHGEVSEYFPAIWRRRVAYVRQTGVAKAGRPQVGLVIVTYRPGQRPTHRTFRAGPTPSKSSYGFNGLDLRGPSVAFSWSVEHEVATGVQSISQLWLLNSRTRRRLAIVSELIGDPFDPVGPALFLTPSLAASFLYTARGGAGYPASHTPFLRIPRSGGSIAVARSAPGMISVSGTPSDGVIYSTAGKAELGGGCADPGTCTVSLAVPLTYRGR